jgi:hypothetical protein
VGAAGGKNCRLRIANWGSAFRCSAQLCQGCHDSVWSLSRIRTLMEVPSLLVCQGCQGCLPSSQVGEGGPKCGARGFRTPHLAVRCSAFDVRVPLHPNPCSSVVNSPPCANAPFADWAFGIRISDFFRNSDFGLRILICVHLCSSVVNGVADSAFGIPHSALRTPHLLGPSVVRPPKNQRS